MTSRAFRAGSDASVLATILDGRPWTAVAIRNLHFRRACRALNRAFHCSNPVADRLRPDCHRLLPLVAERSRLLAETHALQNQIVPALVRVAAHSCSWLRDPQDWQASPEDEPIAQWRDLLRHLFAAWQLPFFLDSVWLLPGDIMRAERKWYLHIGKGGSWRSAEGFPDAITRRALHHTAQAPDHLDVYQALRWGQLRSWGATDALVAEVLQSRMVRDLAHEGLWSSLLEKVAMDPSFDPLDFGVIADVIRSLLARHRTNHADDLVSLPLIELRRHCYCHWQRVLDCWDRWIGIPIANRDVRSASMRAELGPIFAASWQPMVDVSPFEIFRKGPRGSSSRWTISEHCSHVRLIREGQLMRHCVGGYGRGCFNGNSAIFALRQFMDDESGRMIPRVTIEVDPHSRSVVQARGRGNRDPDRLERDLIRIWAGRNQLKMAV